MEESKEQHRKKMYWTFRQVVENYLRCDQCDKVIICHVYSLRNDDRMRCCSSECVDAWEDASYCFRSRSVSK
jgi:hypothetical protein